MASNGDSWFRSSPMDYVQMYIPADAAEDIVRKLGDDREGVIQFVDLNHGASVASRDPLLTTAIQKCDEGLALVNFLGRQLREHLVTPVVPTDAEYAAWERRQLEDRMRESERYSDVLDLWSATLKRLASEHRKLEAAVEQQLVQISQTQSTIELWEVVARYHGLDATRLSAEALSEVRTLVVEGPRAVAGPDEVDLSMRGGAGAAAGAMASGTGGSARMFVGLIDPVHAGPFERMLRKVSRRTVEPKFLPVSRPLVGRQGEEVQRTAFVVPLLGEELPRRILAVMESYDTYRLDDNDEVVRSAVLHGDRAAIKAHLKDALAARTSQLQHLLRCRRGLNLEEQDRCADVEFYRRGLLRKRATAFTITKFRDSAAGAAGAGGAHEGAGSFLRAEGWVLRSKSAELRADLASKSGFLEVVDPEVVDRRGRTPPTHFPLNEFMAPFQSIVDTYSTPRYQEVNPAIFTSATFPFLFGVMYGDVGHASVLTIASIAIVFSRGIPSWLAPCCCCCRGRGGPPAKREKGGEFAETLWFARYVLVLMGLFGVYMGFLYNDLFSIGLSIFGETEYVIPAASNTTRVRNAFRPGSVDSVYPFGFDPVWHESSNQLMYFNSLKMKMAIIIAVVHMTLGLVIRIINDWFSAQNAPSPMARTVAFWKIWLEDVPMIIVLHGLFGYMSFLIFLKWCTDWSAPGAGQPASLVDTMIGMVLSPGTIKDPLYENQALVQIVLLLLVVAFVPVILFGKPCVERCLHRAAASRAGRDIHRPSRGAKTSAASRAAASAHGEAGLALTDHADYHSDAESGSHAPLHAYGAAAEPALPVAVNGDENAPAGGHGGHEFRFGDAMVHQGIETIEFVLSTISHTASYLRLWALSLAHSQLSEVFWDRALRATIEMELSPAIVVGFAIWAGATIGILCMMDVLECYLHALRLHWVEFNTKFFRGEGEKFLPLSFATIIEEETASD
ncbi:hypothetical protein FNF27_04502 [Cafeteria roenbergensis]|uniref:V-type proton ATPase subunit a n=2 Tax=Cafeteria roenbergensis TaxID=33653 RepID=A0A5A8EDD9_CAFRO|nr:hypothetical protein FNF27_04502 [Cafeteria roenbergensis]